MTKRTKTDLVSNVIEALLLDNDGGEISPQDLRTGFIDTADSVLFWDNTTPASASETCSAGEVRFASTGGIYFLYVCVATNTWRRSEMTSF